MSLLRVLFVAIRIVGGVIVGAAVTWSLLGLMQVLIATSEEAIKDTQNLRMLDFVRVERQETVKTKDRRPKRPASLDAPPPPQPRQEFDDIRPGANVIEVSAAVPSEQFGTSNMGPLGFSGAIADGEYLPIVKVLPVYPQRAAMQGLEGYVIVEFTVTVVGSVRDVVVVESSSKLFENAATSAALKFKYKPRVIDGQAVEVTGVRNMITFILDS